MNVFPEEDEGLGEFQGNQTYVPFATFQNQNETLEEDQVQRLIRNLQISPKGSPIDSSVIQNTNQALKNFYFQMQTSLFSFLDQPIDKQIKAEGLSELYSKLDLTGRIQERVERSDTTEAQEWMEAKLASCDGSGVTLFQNQMKQYLDGWREVSQEVIQSENALHNQLELYKKFRAKTLEILLLPENEEKEGVVTAFHKYLETELKRFRIEELFQSCLKGYSKMAILQGGMTALRFLETQTQVPTCGVCFGEPVSRCLIPCGHTFCQDCAEQSRFQCFVCRSPIRRTQKIFFS